MNSDFENLKSRTQKFALGIINLTRQMCSDQVSKVLGNQLLRAGTSVGANYRSACRARSKADFISKITIVEEEADECVYWLELIEMSETLNSKDVANLKKEASELTAILLLQERQQKNLFKRNN
jgi:four helix bundle protein